MPYERATVPTATFPRLGVGLVVVSAAIKCAPLTRGTRLDEEPSYQLIVDLGPHLGGIVVMGPVDLPSSAGVRLSPRGAPVAHGTMRRRQSRVRSTMNRHRHRPRR